MRIPGIYKIQSIVKPDRCYIGSAINISDRWSKHLSQLRKNEHHSIQLQRHFNKYGESDLMFSILLGCEKNDLLKTEQYFLDSCPSYFNTCKVAGSSLGVKYSKERNEKISKGKKGSHRSQEACKKTSDSLKKTWELRKLNGPIKLKNHSEEANKKKSERMKGENNHFFGKHHTEKTKERNKIFHIGKDTWNKGLKNPEGVHGKIKKII